MRSLLRVWLLGMAVLIPISLAQAQYPGGNTEEKLILVQHELQTMLNQVAAQKEPLPRTSN